jgi:hypothetical protein
VPPQQYAPAPGQATPAPPQPDAPGQRTPAPPQQYSPGPYTPAPGGPVPLPAVTVPPQTPPPDYYTPQPVAHEQHRRGPRFVLWLVVLVVLAGGAAAAALVLRPNDEPAPRAGGTATPSAAPGNAGPQRFVTAAYDVALPAGWEQQCSEQVVCNKARLDAGGRRSAFAKGSGAAGAGTTIDHYELAGGLTLERLAESQEQTLNQLAGYVRTGDGKVRTMTPAPGREARTFTFLLRDPNERHGAVIVFKHDKDAYVVTTTAPDAKTAEDAAGMVAETLEPKA